MYMFLEKNMWDDEFYSEMKQACMDAGCKYSDISFVEIFNDIPKEKKAKMAEKIEQMKSDFVFPYGCINFVKYLAKEVEGVFWNANFDLHTYMSHWLDYMVNTNGYFTTYGILKNHPPYELYGDKFFVRPDKNNKLFSGRLFEKDRFAHDIVHMGYSFPAEIDPHEFVYVAPAKNIKREFRFAIIEGKVVTGTQYNENRFSKEVAGCDNPEIWELAQKIASDPWQPDVMYTMDICEYTFLNETRIGLLEIGCLNCSGLYKMDISLIVRAIKTWADKYVKDVSI